MSPIPPTSATACIGLCVVFFVLFFQEKVLKFLVAQYYLLRFDLRFFKSLIHFPG